MFEVCILGASHCVISEQDDPVGSVDTFKTDVWNDALNELDIFGKLAPDDAGSAAVSVAYDDFVCPGVETGFGAGVDVSGQIFASDLVL